MDIENVKQAATHMQKAMQLLSSGPLDYYLTEMAGAHDFMMARCCPYKIGDRVELAVTPNINERDSWGWMASKHFLIEGSPGVVMITECGSNGFKFAVVFDNETWIDREGNKQPVDRKHSYYFGEKSLRKESAS